MSSANLWEKMEREAAPQVHWAEEAQGKAVAVTSCGSGMVRGKNKGEGSLTLMG